MTTTATTIKNNSSSVETVKCCWTLVKSFNNRVIDCWTFHRSSSSSSIANTHQFIAYHGLAHGTVVLLCFLYLFLLIRSCNIIKFVLHCHQSSHSIWIRRKANPNHVLTVRFDFDVTWLVTSTRVDTQTSKLITYFGDQQ